MGIRDLILVILYLTSMAYPSTIHEPQVREELDEHPPEYVRTVRHLDGTLKTHQPPLFNYHATPQQDRLKSRYHHQQQADLRNLKTAPVNPNKVIGLQQHLNRNRGTPMSIPFEDNNDDWKPFQPTFLGAKIPTKPTQTNQEKDVFESVKQKDTVRDLHENDLDIASSDTKENTVKTERQDQQQYIYVAPSILKNNFGLDSQTAQQILYNSAPKTAQASANTFPISELQQLLGKNPEFQLEGLQKLLEEASPLTQENVPTSSQKEVPDIQIEHNGSPSSLPIPQLQTLQQQVDAINKAQEEKVLAEAQRQAQAHVQAQHQAIALAEKKAQEEALAKIAAHNQGLSTLSPSDHVTAAPLTVHSHQDLVSEEKPDETVQEIEQNSVEFQQHDSNLETAEISALQERPTEQVAVHPVESYRGSYASPAHDLRNVKPRILGSRGRFYRPVSWTRPDTETPKLQYLSASPALYNQQHVRNYSPISPYNPRLVTQSEVHVPKIIPESTEPSVVHLPILQNHGTEVYQHLHVEPSANSGKQLYSDDDLHQYAAKYAFGYRILDDKHGNDFGHEEKRDGHLTKGHYYVTLPDGRKQRVEYYADNSGYHARVTYEHLGRHPHILKEEHAEHGNHLESVHK